MKLLDYDGLQYFYSKILTNINAVKNQITDITNGTTAAGKATKLATQRNVQTNLASTSTAPFDGTEDITPGVSGILPITNGGTGADSAAGALSKLGITATAAELNYCDGVTSSIQTQIDDKLSVSSMAYVRHYSTLGALKSAVSSLTNGMTVVTLGYHSENDGGGAKYCIRTKTSADVDNGGTIIVLNSSLVAEMIVEKNTINVKQFGAKGDGTTDDTTAIQNAINAIPYGTVNFTAGGFIISSNKLAGDTCSYKVTSTLIIDKSKVTINGNGACIASSALPIFTVQGVSSSARIEYVTIKDLTLVSTASNPYADFGIRSKYTLHTIIDNVRVLGTGGGIYCNLNVNMLIRNTRIQTFYPNTYDTSTLARGIFLDGDNESRGDISSNASSRFENVLVDMSMTGTSNTVSVAFDLEGYDNRDLFFSNCECCNCDYGFQLTGALRSGESYVDWNFDIFVDNFICDAYKKVGIRIANLQNSGGVHFSRCYLAAANVPTIENAIFVNDSNGVTFTDCQIYGDTAPGIVAVALTSVSDFMIRGCLFHNCNMCIQSIDNSKISILDNIIKAVKGYFHETLGSPSYGTAFYIVGNEYCDISHNKLVTDTNCIYTTYIGIADSNDITVAYNVAKMGTTVTTDDAGTMLCNSGNTNLIAVGMNM